MLPWTQPSCTLREAWPGRQARAGTSEHPGLSKADHEPHFSGIASIASSRFMASVQAKQACRVRTPCRAPATRGLSAIAGLQTWQGAAYKSSSPSKHSPNTTRFHLGWPGSAYGSGQAGPSVVLDHQPCSLASCGSIRCTKQALSELAGQGVAEEQAIQAANVLHSS